MIFNAGCRQQAMIYGEELTVTEYNSGIIRGSSAAKRYTIQIEDPGQYYVTVQKWRLQRSSSSGSAIEGSYSYETKVITADSAGTYSVGFSFPDISGSTSYYIQWYVYLTVLGPGAVTVS